MLTREQEEIKRLLGDSNTEVDKAMVAAIDHAVTMVGTAIRELSQFRAAANTRAQGL